MCEKTKKPGAALFFSAVLIVLMSGYSAAYFWMVEPELPRFAIYGPWTAIRLRPDYSGKTLFSVGHRDEEFWERIFAPIHWADLKLRPNTWNHCMAPLPVTIADAP